MRYLHLADNNNLDASDEFSKVRALFNMINENCLKNFIPGRNISIEESMVRSFLRQACKQYMQSKPVKFGYKLWLEATLLGYAIQFYSFAGKDANYDKDYRFGCSVAMPLVSELPAVLNPSYHGAMDNFFTTPNLLRLLKSKDVAATSTVRANQTENSPLSSVDEMEKQLSRTCDLLVDSKSNVAVVRWKNNKENRKAPHQRQR